MPNCSQNKSLPKPKEQSGRKPLPTLSSEPRASLLLEQGCSWLPYVNTEGGGSKQDARGKNPEELQKARTQKQQRKGSVPGTEIKCTRGGGTLVLKNRDAWKSQVGRVFDTIPRLRRWSLPSVGHGGLREA